MLTKVPIVLNPKVFLVAASLLQGMNSVYGIISGFGLLGCIVMLMVAGIQANSGRDFSTIKFSLIGAGFCGLAGVIALAMFAAGGFNMNLTPNPVN